MILHGLVSGGQVTSKPDSPTRALALEDEQLVTKGEHLGVKRSPAAEQGSERAKNGQNGKHHSCISLAQLREILNDCGVDQVLGRHRTRVLGEPRNREAAREFRGVSSEFAGFTRTVDTIRFDR